MDGTKIEIDLAQFLGVPDDEFNFRDVVVAEAARRALDGETRTAVRERVTRIADDEIRSVLKPMIEEALTRAIQPTNSYGELKGAETTLREVIVERTRKWMTEVDPDAARRLNSTGARPTRIEAMIEKEVAVAVRTDLKDAMEEARKQVADGVREKAAEVISETIARMALPR